MAIDVTAGQRLTAATLNAFVPMYFVVGTDQSVTTTFANWNVGALTFGANQIWDCFIMLDYSVSANGNTFQTQWVAPTGGATQSRIFDWGPSAAAATVSVSAATESAFQSRTQGANVGHNGTTSTTIRGVVFQRFTVTTVASGSITPQVAVNTGTGTLYTGSYFVAHRLS